MKNTIILIIITIIFSGCCDIICQRENYANLMIERINEFQKNNNYLPDNISEIGFIEEIDNKAYYDKTSDSTYIVWYGLELGTSMVYNSKSRKWTKEY